MTISRCLNLEKSCTVAQPPKDFQSFKDHIKSRVKVSFSPADGEGLAVALKSPRRTAHALQR